MVCQPLALNILINSYDLHSSVSNQIVEIKSVFKKFEKGRLRVQVRTLTNQYPLLILIAYIKVIVERSSLSLMPCMVAFRNLIELMINGSEFDFSDTIVCL